MQTEKKISIEIYDRIADISSIDWNACAGLDNPFVQHAFLNNICWRIIYYLLTITSIKPIKSLKLIIQSLIQDKANKSKLNLRYSDNRDITQVKNINNMAYSNIYYWFKEIGTYNTTDEVDKVNN